MKLRIFSYSRSVGKYSFFDVEGSVYTKERIRTEDGGVIRCVEGSVRIMTNENLNISPGDYLSMSKNSAPNKAEDWLITAVRDNRRGSRPHWRIIMEVVA